MKEMIIDATTKIFEKYSTKEVVNEAENGQWPNALWTALVESGMTTVAIPEQLGGNGGDAVDAFSILRLAGRYSAPIPLAETFIVNWFLTSLGEKATTKIATISCSNDLNVLPFERTESGWSVSGTIKDVPWGRFAQQLLVFGTASEGAVISLVNLDEAEIIERQNLAGEARDEVRLHNASVQTAQMIVVDMAEQLKKLQYIGALTRSAMMAGAMDQMLDLTVNYTKERNQFGRPLHRFQAIQHQLALLAGETAAAGIAVECAVASYNKKAPFSKEIALAKIRVNEASGKTSNIAHQVLAAIGFTHEHTLHHSSRRLWSWRDEYGTETAWEQVVTETLLESKHRGLWSLLTNVENSVKKVEL